MNQKELFFISITIFLTIVAWMLLDVYRAQTSSFEMPVMSSEQVNYKIDPGVLNQLKQKQP